MDRFTSIAHRSDAYSRPLFAPRTLFLGHNCEPRRAIVTTCRVFGELDNFPEARLGTLIAMARSADCRSAVCQGGDLPQAQQSTVGGHERQAKHFCCSGQKAIRWIRMLKGQFLGCNDDFVCQWSLAHVHCCLCHPISDRTVQVYPTLSM
jgi:hypothetical protein